MAAILSEAIGTGTEWMNGYRQAQREDKAELDRLRAENKEFRLILEAILNGSGYHGYALAGRARAILGLP